MASFYLLAVQILRGFESFSLNVPHNMSFPLPVSLSLSYSGTKPLFARERNIVLQNPISNNRTQNGLLVSLDFSYWKKQGLAVNNLLLLRVKYRISLTGANWCPLNTTNNETNPNKRLKLRFEGPYFTKDNVQDNLLRIALVTFTVLQAFYLFFMLYVKEIFVVSRFSCSSPSQWLQPLFNGWIFILQ